MMDYRPNAVDTDKTAKFLNAVRRPAYAGLGSEDARARRIVALGTR
jgi:hypothetical protein